MDRNKPSIGQPRTSRWRDAAVTLPFSLSQIFFKDKAISGLLILAAFAVASWHMALLVVIGSASSSFAGLLMRVPEHDVRSGLQGFCGALVGAASYAALGDQWLGFLAAVLGGLACGPVTWAVVRVLESRPLKPAALPYTTAPFCIVAGLMFLATSGHHVAKTVTEVDDSLRINFPRSLLTNVSEVVLIDNVVAGALIVLALFVAHWKVGLAALLGSVLESFMTLALHENVVNLGQGLLGYSGVLVSIAMAAVFLRGTWQPWFMAVVGAVMAGFVTLLVEDLSGVYTWPYVVTTWTLLVVVHFVPGFERTLRRVAQDVDA